MLRRSSQPRRRLTSKRSTSPSASSMSLSTLISGSRLEFATLVLVGESRASYRSSSISPFAMWPSTKSRADRFLFYFLLARNGTGKSTLLSALRDGLIPGLPPTVRILLVSQTEEDSSPDLKNNAVNSSATMSVLEKVIASDRPRARAMREFESVFCSSPDSTYCETDHNPLSFARSPDQGG